MTIFNTIFMNFTWILFPIMLFLIYEAYSENINTKQNELFLNFCLISAIYLIIKCGTFENYKRTIEIMIDTIIITLYLKKHYKSSILTSILGIIIIINLKLEIIPTIIKYFIYYYSYKTYSEKEKYQIIFTFATRLLCTTTIILITNMQKLELIEYISYYILTYFIIIFLIKAEKIIEIHISYKELMKEHQLKESLFKISHEIKNPIAVCKGYLDMCKSSENYEKYLPILKSEINKTLNLLPHSLQNNLPSNILFFLLFLGCTSLVFCFINLDIYSKVSLSTNGSWVFSTIIHWLLSSDIFFLDL